jgi:hypothetical protein
MDVPAKDRGVRASALDQLDAGKILRNWAEIGQINTVAQIDPRAPQELVPARSAGNDVETRQWDVDAWMIRVVSEERTANQDVIAVVATIRSALRHGKHVQKGSDVRRGVDDSGHAILRGLCR